MRICNVPFPRKGWSWPAQKTAKSRICTRLFVVPLVCLLGAPGFAQVKLGNVVVPKDHIIVFIAIGHSNLQSAWASTTPDTNLFVGVNPRIWNFNIADQFDLAPQHQWLPASEPIHQRNSGIVESFGPGMPFLKNLIAKLPPDYYLGIVQNAEGRAQLKAHYVDNNTTDYGTNLYSQIHDAITALDTTVTWGGVITMIGIVENDDSIAASNFATNMDTLIIRLRNLTKTPSLPFLITQYEKGATGDYAITAHYGLTIARQIDSIPTFVPHTFVVPTDWTVDTLKYLNDSHHFNAVGQIYWAGLASAICDSAHLFSGCTRDSIPPDPPAQARIDSVTCRGAWLSWQPSHDNVGCKDYHVVSSQGLDTNIYATQALLPVSADSPSVAFTIRAIDLSANQSTPVVVSRVYSLACNLSAPDSLRLIRSTSSSLTMQWSCSSGKGHFLVYVADSLSAVADSDTVTVCKLLPKHVYSVRVAFTNPVGAVSLSTPAVSCTTKAVSVAAIPLMVDFAAAPHGAWVSENMWSDTVAHGMLEPLPKENVPIGPLLTCADSVMATLFEGEMQYIIRAPRDEYLLTLYLYDPFVHAARRTFTLSVDAAAHADSIINSPGLLNGNPWSAMVSFDVVTDSIIRFSLTKDSTLMPVASGFSLVSVNPFTVTVADTVAIGDTLHVGWTCNQTSVGSADVFVSADSGKSWTMVNTTAIGRSDASWGKFCWVVPPALGLEQLASEKLKIKVSDYNDILFGTTNCFVRSSIKNRMGVQKDAGRLRIVTGNNCVRIQGKYQQGELKIFKISGQVVRSMVLHGPQTIDLGKFPRALYFVELKIDGKTFNRKMIVK